MSHEEEDNLIKITKEEKTRRIHKSLADEIDGIKKERVKRKIDKKKISDIKITALIPRHGLWKKMKEDLITIPFSKKGSATSGLISFIIISFIIIIVMGTFAYLFNIITTSIGGIEQMAGSVNITEATNDTLGKLNTALLDKLNIMGIFVLFGLVFGMLINAYFTRDQFPQLFLLIDVVLLIFAYILSVYISNAYETIILLEPFSSIFISNLAKASQFLLKLPIIVTIIGFLIMLITYSNIPRSRKEEAFIGAT